MEPNAGRLLVRADAGPRVGSGHVMRCLAIAQAWQDAGGEAVLVSSRLPPHLLARLADEKIEIVELAAEPATAADAAETGERATAVDAAWIVADGYHFGAAYHDSLAGAGRGLLLLDDTGRAGRYTADLVLDPNLDADEARYRDRSRRTRLLLGSRYAPLRREFRRWTCWTREARPVAKRLLLTVGGGAWYTLVRMLLDAVTPLTGEGLEIEVVFGGPARQGDSLRAAGLEDRVHSAVSVVDMPGLMARSELALSAAGTCWELAFMSVPALIFSLADNQRRVADAVAATGAMIDLGLHEELDPGTVRERVRALMHDEPARRAMARRGRELVDGEGAARVVEAMLATTLPESVPSG